MQVSGSDAGCFAGDACQAGGIGLIGASTVIEVEELTKRYGARPAVEGVSFHVERGEVVGFLGPNGAGKSTTLRMITGFLNPTSGRIRVGGLDTLVDPLGVRRQIGYMPEGVPLYPEMRVGEYLRYRAELKEVPGRQSKSRVGAALEAADITDVEDRIIGQLSKGYRQRVGLADALVADPPLLILDEPTAGLDPNQIRHVRELIGSFKGKKTVFLSTHILTEVEAMCERVVIIHKGKLVGEGTPDSLEARTAGEQRVTLVVRGEDDAVDALTEALHQVPGVSQVAIEALPADGVKALTLSTEAGADVMERVFAQVVEAGVALRQLTREEERLEDVFASLTHAEEEEIRAGLAAPTDVDGVVSESDEDSDEDPEEDNDPDEEDRS